MFCCGHSYPVQSHFGAWVVCAERLGPFQVTGLASDGTVLATLDYWHELAWRLAQILSRRRPVFL